MLSGESSRVALGYEALLNNMGTEALTSVDCFAYVTQTAYVQHMTVDCFWCVYYRENGPTHSLPTP